MIGNTKDFPTWLGICMGSGRDAGSWSPVQACRGLFACIVSGAARSRSSSVSGSGISGGGIMSGSGHGVTGSGGSTTVSGSTGGDISFFFVTFT